LEVARWVGSTPAPCKFAATWDKPPPPAAAARSVTRASSLVMVWVKLRPLHRACAL
jgi:hypothetical protein